MSAKRSLLLLGAIAVLAACGAPAAEVAVQQSPAVSIAPTHPAPPAPPPVKDPHLTSTWVPRLSDPATQANAVERLAAIYEANLRRDEGNRQGPNAKPVADAAAKPLNDLCKGSALDAEVRKKTTLLLASMRDPRGAPCLVEALSAYAPGHTDAEVGASAKALAAMGVRDASGPLFNVFVKLDYGSEGGARIARDVHDAMVTLVDPAWEDRLIGMLDRPMPQSKDIPRIKEALYWQITSAEMLGLLRSEKAIEPLLRVLLSPAKADAQATAARALLAIGKPAVGPAAALLRGENKALVAYAREEAQRAHDNTPLRKGEPPPHVGPAALVLGVIGREECAAPLLEALPKADPVSRAILARELVKLPATPEAMKAFKKTFEATPLELTIPPGMHAREAMLEEAAFTFDAELVPWIVQTALAVKGDEEDLAEIRGAAFQVAMKLMTSKQVAVVEKLHATKVMGPDGKPIVLGNVYQQEWKHAKEVLAACQDDRECWMRELTAPASQRGEQQMRAIKAAYMIGVLGKPEIRARLVDALPKIENLPASYVAARVVDRLSPRGAPDLADKLEALVREAEQSKDQHRIAQRSFLKEIISRLRARAQ